MIYYDFKVCEQQSLGDEDRVHRCCSSVEMFEKMRRIIDEDLRSLSLHLSRDWNITWCWIRNSKLNLDDHL